MKRFLEQLRRGLFLRCPVCGEGKLFRVGFTMHEQCQLCHFHYEREVGYYSGAMALDLIFCELLVVAIVVPLAANPSVPVIPLFLWSVPLAIILPIVLFWHSRGLWMSMDHFARPVAGYGHLPEIERQQASDTEMHS